MNHVELMYGVIAEVSAFAATFRDFPPRSYPPSFNPGTIVGDTIRDIKAKQKLEQAFPMLQVAPPAD